LDVTVPTGRASRAGIVVHRARIEPHERTVRDGIPTTTLPRTLLDLAAVLDARTLARAFEEAQVQHRLRPAVLAGALASSPGRRGATRLRALLADAVEPGQVESVLELRFLELCAAHDLPRPRTQAQLGPWRVDFWFPSLRVAVETDGARFHATAAKRARDARRDAALEAAGVRVLRLRWADVTGDPAGAAAAVRAATRQGSIAKRSSPSPRTKSSEAVTR
jgi:very-short-patch-repair endonuclease